MARWTRRAVVGLSGLGLWSIKTASDVRELGSKFNVVFAGMTDEVRAWAAQHADAVGRSKYDMEAYLANIGDLLKPMGFTTQAAADMAKEIVKLGGDLASFNNKSDPKAILAVTKAFLGEREMLKDLGVQILEADVKAEALALGLTKGREPVTLMAKAQATLSLLMKRSKDAQGDQIRTLGELANRAKAVQSKFKDFRVELGNQIIDGLELATVLGKVSKKVGEFTEKLKKSGVVERWAGKAREAFQDIEGIMDALMEGGPRGDQMKAGIKEWGQLIAESLNAKMNEYAPAIGAAIGKAAWAAFKAPVKLAGAAVGERSVAAAQLGSRERSGSSIRDLWSIPQQLEQLKQNIGAVGLGPRAGAISKQAQLNRDITGGKTLADLWQEMRDLADKGP